VPGSTFRAVRAPMAEAPPMAPRVPPMAMKPKRRLPWSWSRPSAMKAQNTDTAKRLKTLSQM